MDQTQQLSIVIPVRIDSLERLANLQAVVKFLLQQTKSPIIILEADTISSIENLEISDRVHIIFRKDDNPIFHRTKYINELLRIAQTQFVGVWDSDIILAPQSIYDAVDIMEQGGIMCLPYNGECIFLSEEMSNRMRLCVTSILENKQIGLLEGFRVGRPAVGGAYIVNRHEYLQVGGENETFYGWGPEDAERVKRIEILGHQVKRTEGCLYHLNHPRGINSTLSSDVRGSQNLAEFSKICSMQTKELCKYINKTLLDMPALKKKLVVVGNQDIACSSIDTFDYVIRINRMTNYCNTGYRTDGLFLEANSIFKNIYTGEKLKEKITENTHIFMNPNWHKKFDEWSDYLSIQQYALTELINYETICSLVGCSNPTSGVALLSHLLSTDWSQEYDIHIVGFELQNRVEMIETDPYWDWHRGAGAAELSFLKKCITSGELIVLDSMPIP